MKKYILNISCSKGFKIVDRNKIYNCNYNFLSNIPLKIKDKISLIKKHISLKENFGNLTTIEKLKLSAFDNYIDNKKIKQKQNNCKVYFNDILHINFNLFSNNISSLIRFGKFKYSTNKKKTNREEDNFKDILNKNKQNYKKNVSSINNKEISFNKDSSNTNVNFKSNEYNEDREYIINSLINKEESKNTIDCNFNIENIKYKKKGMFDFSDDDEENVSKDNFNGKQIVNKINLKEDNDPSKKIEMARNTEIKNDLNSEIKKIIPRSELRKMIKEEDYLIMKKVRGSGPGGQHINKTSSAVFLKDPKTNIAIKVSNSRDSIVNEGIAKKRILDKLDLFYNGKESKIEKNNEKIRKQKSKAMKRSAEKHTKNDDKKN